MKKRLLSILFTLAVCVGLLSVTALATDDGHTHSYTNGFCTENGCGAYQPAELKDGVYQIANAGQLYWFAGLVNGDASVCVGDVTKNTAANAVLTENITVNTGVLNADGTVNMGEQNGDGTSTVTFRTWTPIGDTSYTALDTDNSVDASNAYAGTFDGRNHTISGLYLNNAEGKNDCALFGMTTSGAQISNLTVADSYFGGRNRVAGVCARNNGSITNCTNRSTVSSSVKTAGGICGWNDSGTITGCTNSGAVGGPKYIGGVCGYNDGTITGCTNSGNVSGTGDYTGGVCGFNSSIGKTENCRNEGTVSGKYFTGGVCGYNNKVNNNIGTITGCTNSGTVNGTSNTGGVCGYNVASGKIENCRNEGTVGGKHYTGGVSGYSYGTITGCTNSGTVTGTDNTGGVCGQNGGTITNCTNTNCTNTNSGTVTGTGNYTGGVCGINGGTGTIENCRNEGNVTGTQNTGGVCGYNAWNSTAKPDPEFGTITNCANSGAVTGTEYSIGGVCGVCNGIVTNCANFGTVSGKSDTGGVCGRNNSGTITNCYFNSNTYLGNAVGSTGSDGTTTDDVEGKTAAQFASGEVAWLLRGGDTDNGSTWGQKIGTDPYPLPNGEKVYKTTPCVTYSNTSGTKEHTDVGGICADCGEVLGTISDPYEIGSQDALNAFVKAVNNGNVSINARLTTDGLTLTTPIGQDADGKRYTGTFDGGNHTLTVTLSGGQDTAPFAAIENTTIKNLRTTGTIQTGGKYAAGLVSNAWHTVTIENCYSDVIITSTVNGDGTHGGLVGRANHDNSTLPSANITIRNCGFAGQINGEKTTSCGGLMGWIHKGQTITVENCYVAGTFTVAREGSDTICRNIESNLVTASVTNFYYLKKLGGFGGGNTDLQANCRPLTAAQFASGEAAYLLNGSASEGTPVWRQNLDNGNTPDAYPLPVGTEDDSTGIVYRVPKFDPCNSETGVEGYSNYNKSKLIHSLTKTDANAPTCTEAGNSAYWTCSVCHKYFSDEAGKTEIEENSWVIPAGHSLTDVTEVPATYESDGVKAHKHCTVCGKDFIGGVEQSTDDLKLPKLVMPIIPVIPTYPPAVTQPAEGGTVTVWPQAPAQGVTVTITPRPEDGYEVGGVSVTDRIGNPVAVKDNGNGTYSFTQPAGAVTVNVTFADKTQLAFTDVSADAYYYDAVQWAVKNGITYGTSDTTFSPDASCTRAQMAAFLWRAAGCPEPKGTSSFTDVPSDAYYAKAVAWAVENGITGGVGNDKFAPDDVCTRAQMAAFLCRLAGGKAEGAGTFTDVSADAYYAEAVQWAVENGITDGVGDNRFAPDATCTRAQIVTFLYRFFVK